MPCGGDAYSIMPPPDEAQFHCEDCGHRFGPRLKDGYGFCLGIDGCAFFLPVALEVAAERADAWLIGYMAGTMEAL